MSAGECECECQSVPKIGMRTMICHYVKTSPFYNTKLPLVCNSWSWYKENLLAPKTYIKLCGELFFGPIPKMLTLRVQISYIKIGLSCIEI